MRRGFTLVEVLVVVIIISLLVAMTTPAIMGARRKAARAVMSMEIYQIDFACKAFKERFGEYPPDFADVDRVKALAQVKRFISRAFPRIKSDRLPKDFRDEKVGLPLQYNASTALIYWLGGIYNSDEGMFFGFSADPSNPFDVDTNGDVYPPSRPVGNTDPVMCTSRIKPVFKFPLGPRVTLSGTTTSGVKLYSFWPPKVDTVVGSAGYVYFRAENRSYETKGWANPTVLGATYDTTVTLPPPKKKWLNAESYQLRCCGLDGMLITFLDPPLNTQEAWWTEWGKHPSVPIDPDIYFQNRDDLSNCWEGQLEDNAQ